MIRDQQISAVVLGLDSAAAIAVVGGRINQRINGSGFMRELWPWKFAAVPVQHHYRGPGPLHRERAVPTLTDFPRSAASVAGIPALDPLPGCGVQIEEDDLPIGESV